MADFSIGNSGAARTKATNGVEGARGADTKALDAMVKEGQKGSASTADVRASKELNFGEIKKMAAEAARLEGVRQQIMQIR